MNTVFRVDASIDIGSGHLMRCLTLAGQLRSRKADTTFICRDLPGAMFELLEKGGYRYSRLPKPGNKPVFPNMDAEETITAGKALFPNGIDWLVVDHYGLSESWEQMLRPHVQQIMVIDDLADRSHDCDLLLDQNLCKNMESRYDSLVPGECIKLIGPQYALLRSEFLTYRNTLIQRDGSVRTIFVFFGGSDTTCETEKTLRAIDKISDRRFEVDVVTGSSNPRKENIATFCSSRPGFRYHCQVENIAELMARADLAIGAGGATTWERCALGLPSLVIAVADNQIPLTTWCGEQGIIFFLGCSRTVSSNKIRDAISLLSTSKENLNAFSTKALQTVDAKGAQRVAGMLCPCGISLRRATMEDCDVILKWRNAVETRRYTFDTETIDPDIHRLWFSATLADPGRVILIGEMSRRPVGVLRYDLSGERAVISVYLVPGEQGQGIGAQLIGKGSQWISEHYPEIKTIEAEILAQNRASIGAFMRADYRKHHLTLKKVL